MTQELLDYLEAGLKMAETGESSNWWWSLLRCLRGTAMCLLAPKFCASWTPTEPNPRLQPDSAD